MKLSSPALPVFLLRLAGPAAVLTTGLLAQAAQPAKAAAASTSSSTSTTKTDTTTTSSTSKDSSSPAPTAAPGAAASPKASSDRTQGAASPERATATNEVTKVIPPDKDIVALATADGDFKVFVKALQTTGLDHTLARKGPFTVFAPTDEAFAKFPKKEWDALLKNKKKLSTLLAYHVIAGTHPAAEAVEFVKPVTTLEGRSLRIRTQGAKVLVGDNATIVKPDLHAKNGIIQGIDAVLTPPKREPK